jgi:16S rRNA (uracil1498-N3)-methyltransferase
MVGSMSERFFIDRPLHPGPIELEGPEAHHLAHVCRLRPGDSVHLFNGDGREYHARVITVSRRDVTVDVVDLAKPERELPFRLEVAAPIPKGDRAQFLIEKLTELGATTFIPLSCQHSIVHPREARRDKFERYVIEASKQCGRNFLMEVGDLTDWASYCQPLPSAISILAHPAASTSGQALLASGLPHALKSAPSLRLAVGPEAGFTGAEVEQARAAGWQTVDLGPRILRIETAALALTVLASASIA